MRRLGSELSVEAMSLYAYVDSKRALLQDIRESFFEQMGRLAKPEGDWRDRLRSVMRATRAVGLLHPSLALLITAVDEGPVGRARHVEDLATLREAGFDEATAHEALTALVGFVIGHIIIEYTNLGRWIDDAADTGDRTPSAVASTSVPDSNSRERSFEFGLDALFTSLESTASSTSSSAT